MRTQYSPFQTRQLLFYLSIFSLLLVTACESKSELPSTPIPVLEPGRTSIRSFKFYEGAQFGDANFSAVLPYDWDAVDTLSGPLVGLDDPPAGILAKMGNTRLQVHYKITPPNPENLIRVRSGYAGSQPVIEGIPVRWVGPINPSASEELLRIDALFPSLPGDVEQRFGLSVSARGVAPSLFDEVKRVIESIRYAPPPPLRNNPAPLVRPGRDWQRVQAHWSGISFADFSVLAPPSTTFTTVPALDTLVGRFDIGDIEMFVEYATGSGPPIVTDGHIRYLDEAEQETWVEVIEGKPFIFYRPVEEHPTGSALTGASTARIPGLPDLIIIDGRSSSEMFSCGGHFYSQDVDRDEQELVLAMLRTIQNESQSTVCR